MHIYVAGICELKVRKANREVSQCRGIERKRDEVKVGVYMRLIVLYHPWH